MDRVKSKSKYNRNDRKRIVESIENLKNDDDYVAILEILTRDSTNSYTQNSNGVFMNISTVSDRTLDHVLKYIESANQRKIHDDDTDNDNDVNIIFNGSNNLNMDRIYKLSNYEKNIIRQRNLKKVLNEDDEYEELRFASGDKKKAPRSVPSESRKNKKTKEYVQSNC